MKPIYCALVHYPVRDKIGDTVASAVTNLDVHDLARSARAYDLAAYFVVSPITAQRAITTRIVEHWTGKRGKVRIQSRSTALARVRPIASIEDTIAAITEEAGKPRVVATAAQAFGRPLVSFAEERTTLATAEQPTLLLFGTGHGLAESVLDDVDAILQPLVGRGEEPFNHLSVRAAFAIILDRLLGGAPPSP